MSASEDHGFDVRQVFDLSQPLEDGMVHHPNHPGFRHALYKRHGDVVGADGKSSASDMITMGTHVGTHIDALGHVSQDGHLFGGVDAMTAQQGGRFATRGSDQLPLMVCRGVLLDVAATRGVDVLPGNSPIKGADLEQAEKHGGVQVRAGDAVLVRTGWSHHFKDAEAFLGHASGVPGPDLEGAQWLVDRQVQVAGSETLSFEYLEPEIGSRSIPVHLLLLVQSGIPIIEVMNLEALSTAQVHEFLFVAAPLHIVGATGAPVRPLALVE